MSGRRRGLLAIACLFVLTWLLLAVAMKMPFSRLDVPYTYGGDAVDKLAQIQTVAETGWLFDSPRLGYPFGYDRLDFPRFDSLNYAIMGPVAALTGEAGLAMNLFYLAGYFLVGLSALWVLRAFGISTGPALICALAYAFLPYHQIRGVAHLTNGAYFLVPLGILVLAWLARGDLDPGRAPRSRWALALATALLLPLQTPYNGVFFALLCVVAGALALARARHWRVLRPVAVLILVVSAAFAVEQIPVWRHAAVEGANPGVAERNAAEAGLLALRLDQVLLPFSVHRVDKVAAAKRAFDAGTAVPRVESRDQYIGLIGIAGLLALMLALARSVFARTVAPDPLQADLALAAVFALAIVLLAMPSGLSGMFAFFVTAKVRAFNRILPFLAFPAMLGAAWLLERLIARLRSGLARSIVLVALGVIALADLTTPRLLGARMDTVRQFDSDRRFFTDMERELGAGSAVFQMPAVWYPEHGPVGNAFDYAGFKPYLHSHTLRFSYGTARGREGHRWAQALQLRPAAEIVAQLRERGFSAILVDTRAYAPQDLASLTAALRGAVTEDARTSTDRRWQLFALPPIEGPRPPATKATAYDIASGPLAFSLGAVGPLHLGNGWDSPEDWGTWSLGESSRLRLQLDPVPAVPLDLVLEARVLAGPRIPQRRIAIRAGALPIADMVRGAGATQLRVALPAGAIDSEGLLDLRIDVSPSASPRDAGVNADPRPLGIGLVSLALEPRPQVD